jgi:predicted RNA-binding protein associated with RNAse of E/G family
MLLFEALETGLYTQKQRLLAIERANTVVATLERGMKARKAANWMEETAPEPVASGA